MAKANKTTDVHFGQVDAPPPDWRNDPTVANEEDPDEVLEKTPEDVIEVLGFDPLELFADDDDDTPTETKSWDSY